MSSAFHQEYQQPPSQRARKRGMSKKKFAILVAATVALLALLAVAVISFVLSPKGSRPYAVSPAGAVAYVEVNLDPGAEQKVGANQFIKKFPREDKGDSDLKGITSEAVANALFAGDTKGVREWTKDRVGISVYPNTNKDGQADVGVSYPDTNKDGPADWVVAIQSKDTKVAENYIKQAAVKDNLAEQNLSAVSRGEYILVSNNLKLIEDDSDFLGDNKDFMDDLNAIDKDSPILAWADLGASLAASNDVSTSLGVVPVGVDAKIEGRMYASVGFEKSGALRATMESTPITYDGKVIESPTADTYDAVSRAASDAAGVLSIAGLGEILTQIAADPSAQQYTTQIQGGFNSVGLEFPQDIKSILGDTVTVSFTSPQKFAVEFTGADKGKWDALISGMGGLESLQSGIGTQLNVGDDNGVTVWAGEKDSGAPEWFNTAMPEGKGAQFAFGVDANKIAPTPNEETDMVGVVGVTTTAQKDGSTRTVVLWEPR